jgi:hypothetical protein
MVDEHRHGIIFLTATIRGLTVICTAALLVGCYGALSVRYHQEQAERRRQERASEAQERNIQAHPGLYDLTGWGGNSVSYDSQRRADVAALDINGEVGHPIYQSGPVARCVPGPNWSNSQRIVSGSLPPGVDFEVSTKAIQGIPTERGHWIVKVELYAIRCNYDTSIVGFTQELRFHITGTGKVVN